MLNEKALLYPRKEISNLELFAVRAETFSPPLLTRLLNRKAVLAIDQDGRGHLSLKDCRGWRQHGTRHSRRMFLLTEIIPII